MNAHKNARLTLHSRAVLVRRVLEGDLRSQFPRKLAPHAGLSTMIGKIRELLRKVLDAFDA